MTQTAFLGTGLLGSAFVEAAAKRGGDSITVWNRTIDKARALEQFGVKVAATPADAVKGASRVHLILKDDAVVEEVEVLRVVEALQPSIEDRELALVAPGGTGGRHGDVRGPVAVLTAGRPLELDPGGGRVDADRSEGGRQRVDQVVADHGRLSAR